MAKTKTDPRTLAEMRAEVKEKNIEQIEKWDDPRLLKLLTELHADATANDYCGTYDQIAGRLGVPPRPKKDYFKIVRTGEVEFGGNKYPVEASVEVYGEVGDDEGAIADYQAKYGKPFAEVMEAALQKNALLAIQKGLVVVTT